MAFDATFYVREVFSVLVKPVNVPVEHDLHVFGILGCDEGIHGIECEGIAVEPSDNVENVGGYGRLSHECVGSDAVIDGTCPARVLEEAALLSR